MKYSSLTDVSIGDIFENNNFQKYEILSVLKVKGKNTKYEIRFLDTGYQKSVEKVEIKRGKIKDKLEKSVFNIGILGDVKMVDYKKEYSVWSGMLERCYSENYDYYYRYGGRGVTVCERWLTFTNFLEDIELIEGYDKVKFYNGEIEIDKDKKQDGVEFPVYSLEGCCFLSKKENVEYRKLTNIFSFYSKNPMGIISKHVGIKKFCKDHPELNRTSITHCLKGRKEEYKGWKFNFNEEELQNG